MPRKVGNSAKAQRDKLRERMRGYGCTVDQIAAELARRFNLRPRVAWRHALGWPQWKLAQQHNTLHPGARMGDNRVSEFEAWPHGGSPPSLRYLAQLAATFGHGCTPAQLVDADDLERLTPAERCLLTTGHPLPTGVPDVPARTTPTSRSPQTLAALPPGQPRDELVASAECAVWAATMGPWLPEGLVPPLMTCLAALGTPDDEALTTPGGRDHTYHRLVRFLTGWADTMKRRTTLRTLGWAATAASIGHRLDPDEQARVAAVLSKAGRVDAQTIEHIEAVLWHCRRQDDALGPQAVLDTVLAQRDLARALVPACPEALRPRMLSALSQASCQAGWLSFDLNQFDHAAYYYEDARALAHEAHNLQLSAWVLCDMSHVATWQDRPRIGIDHAVAAGQWANRTDDMLVRAYAADVTARAYAADGQRDACLRALDTAHTALTAAGDQPPGYVYLYDEAIHTKIRGACHLTLHDAQRAVDYLQQSLKTLDPSLSRETAFATAHLGMAYTQCTEIDEAARLLGDAGEIAAHHSSARLTKIIGQARAELQPWAHTAAVHTLDDRLRSCGVLLT